MPKNKKCQFKTDLVKDYTCPEPALKESDYCIFHKPHKTEKEAKSFKTQISKKLQNKDYNFTGYYVPRGINFENQLFQGDVDFTESTFEAEIGFWKSTFKGVANFEKSTFRHDAHFDELTFKEEAFFGDSIFERAVDFDGIIFEGDVDFISLTFKKAINLRRLTFKRDVTFAFSTFHATAWFAELIFWGEANFRGTIFQGIVDFDRLTFKGNVKFKESTFQKIDQIKEMVFENNASADQFFRIAKSYYQKEGEYTLAGEYYYKERIVKRKQLLWYSPKRWFEYIFLDGLCGYGERPLRAIRTGLGVVFGLALLYWRIGHIFPSPELFNEPHTLTFWDALYFSVVTFTTLGFGDWRPDPSHWIRYIVMSEAFIGAFLMALFIVTFARRMMR